MYSCARTAIGTVCSMNIITDHPMWPNSVTTLIIKCKVEIKSHRQANQYRITDYYTDMQIKQNMFSTIIFFITVMAHAIKHRDKIYDKHQSICPLK